MFNNLAKWIWVDKASAKNQYAYFMGDFDFGGDDAVLKLAADTDYIAYLNGQMVGFGQFAGYPFKKYYDTLPLKEFLVCGKNSLKIVVRYEGVNSATHIDDGAGLIFAVESEGKTLAYSNEEITAGIDGEYIEGLDRDITIQLGLTVGMQKGDGHPLNTISVNKTMNLLPRPVKKTVACDEVKGVPLNGNKYVFDFGNEYAGYLKFKVNVKTPQKLVLAYSEHLTEGQVPRIIHGRNFSLDFDCVKVDNEFTCFFLRVAARYVQVIFDDEPISAEVSILPYLYPLTEKKVSLTGVDLEIYNTCIRTLRLCMNTHYEDCPWREQALYVLDSRNQMLCGYKAFNETEFQRGNLVFIANGMRKEGVLELTYPAKNTPAIPFFSVMYPVAVYEYVENTGDTSILGEVMDTMLKIFETLASRIDHTGLLRIFPAPFWNFYEWSNSNSGVISGEPDNRHDLILNCAYVYSAQRLMSLAQRANVDFTADTEGIKNRIKDVYWNDDNGLFCTADNKREHFSQLGNAFAVLIGLGDQRTVEAIKGDKLVPATLSMLGYVYDALLLADEKNAQFVLNDIRQKYGMMLKSGATTFWETFDGAEAFDGAGSLCHGWSAMPVYYYHKLGLCD